MIQSESIKELATALAKAQGAIKGAKKDSVNPHFKSAYADLESTWEACREPLSKNGLSVVQFPYSTADGRTGIETMLLHDSGEWIKGNVDVQMSQATNPQVAGSIYSYLRRYSLQAAVGINSADDDSNTASPKPFVKTVEPKPANPVASPPPATVENQDSAPPAGEEKTIEDLRRDLDELGQIAVDAGIYTNLGDAIQSFTTTEKFKSKCRDVAGLSKDWAVKNAIKKAQSVLNAPAQPEDDDIPF